MKGELGPRPRLPRSGGDAGLPDMRWINRELPILDVARQLDIRLGANGLVHCWHPERHSNGDRTASVGLRKRTNTVKCFGHSCGVGPLGPIDLVRDVRSLATPAEAAKWIAARFPVPQVPKGAHLTKTPARGRPAGMEGSIGLLVQSGLWGSLSAATRCIVPALVYFADWQPGTTTAVLTMSYRGIQRYSGVASFSAISKAIRELEEIGWMRKASPEHIGPVRNVNTYCLTPESDDLWELGNAMARQTRDEVEAERQLRKEARVARRASLENRDQRAGSRFTQYRSLSCTDSTNQNDAMEQVA